MFLAHGTFRIPPNGEIVTGCVGEGQKVLVSCNEGSEVIQGSGMSSMEIICDADKPEIWSYDFCGTVNCDFPYDWLKFTGNR